MGFSYSDLLHYVSNLQASSHLRFYHASRNPFTLQPATSFTGSSPTLSEASTWVQGLGSTHIHMQLTGEVTVRYVMKQLVSLPCPQLRMDHSGGYCFIPKTVSKAFADATLQCTIEPLIKVPLKNNYDLQRCLV